MRIRKRIDIKSWLGGFSPGFNAFLIVHTSFLVFTRLPAVFINTMMMAPGEGIEAVIFYNASFFISGALFMAAAAYVLKRSSARLTIVIGILSYLLLYLLIIALGEQAAKFHVLIGLVNGIADGFYWISYGQLLTSTLSVRNRDRGLAVINVIASSVNLLIPLFSGLLIRMIGGLGGYITVMAIASAVAVFTCLISMKLPRIKAAGEKKEAKTNFIAAARILKMRPLIMTALLGQSAKGIREGAFSFILSVVLYQSVRDELLIGINTFLSSSAGILAYVYMSRTIRADNRIRFMLLSVLSLCVLSVLGMLWINPLMLIVYSAINAAFVGPIVNGGYTIFLDSLTSEPEAKNRYPELLAFNECFLVTGRCIGLGLIYLMGRLFGESVFNHMLSLMLLSLSQFLTLRFSGAADKGIRNQAAL